MPVIDSKDFRKDVLQFKKNVKLAYSHQLPQTNIRTSHAISIRVNGQTIGMIQQWSPSQARVVTPIYEINAVGTGEMFEQVPGIGTNYVINIVRFDLYSAKMEEVWGSKYALWMLTDQHDPFDIEEKWLRYNSGTEGTSYGIWGKVGKAMGKAAKAMGSVTGQIQGFTNDIKNDIGDESEGQYKYGDKTFALEKLWYSGCYFSYIGRNISATGDRIVNVNAVLNYSKVRPLA